MIGDKNQKSRRLLSIGTDRSLFEEGSAVRARQAEYAKDWDEVHIVVFSKIRSKISEIMISPNCWAYSTQSRFKSLYPFDAIRLGRFIIERRGITDITCQDPFLTAMAGVSLKKQFGIPLEIQVHTDIGSPNFTYSVGNKVMKFLARNYLPKADSIRVVSDKIKDYLVGKLGIDSKKITVRPIVVDTEWIKNAPIIEGADLHKKYPQFEKIVLMASRLEKEKNVGLAIEAWSLVVKRNPKAGLIIVGSGSQILKLKVQGLKLGLIKNIGTTSIGDGIIFEPLVDKTTLVSYYKTADIFLNTSLFEGYGMTLVEAHAVGCPIVSTDVGVAREVGATIVPYEAAQIAETITTILRSPRQ